MSIVEDAKDFKKLKLYKLEGVGDSIIAFQYWSGGTCCNTAHILNLRDGKFKILPESLIDRLKSIPTN